MVSRFVFKLLQQLVCRYIEAAKKASIAFLESYKTECPGVVGRCTLESS
jgi:hypothetical protein